MSSLDPILTIRTMTASDVEWAQRLAADSPQAPHWPAAAYLAAIDPRGSPPRIALVAELPASMNQAAPNLDRLGQISTRQGFVVAGMLPPQSELESIVVERLARRTGVGRALMAALTDRLRSAGVTEVTLEVRASNGSALSFYQRFGFRKAGRRARYYADPVEDAVLVQLHLAGAGLVAE